VNFAASTDEIAKGNFTAALPEVHTEDEIGLLHDSFANMQQSLTQYVEELRESTATRASIEKELKIASNIQMSMLPKKFPPYPKRTDIDIYGHMTPAKTVGGDLFDFHISDEKLYFCLGDVSGKGIPASLFMGGAVTLFNSISAHESMPDRIMTQMNDMMVKRNDTFMFVTLFIGVLDLKTGHLDYCNGGHDAPLLFTADGVTRLPVQKNLAVGLMPGMVYEGNEADIVPNSTIFLYTDGLTEAADEHDTLYGPEHLMEEANLALADHQLMPKGLVEFFVDSVNTFVGNAEQSDDLTMLAVRYMK
jgi:sigma-B regulation protein RsbU (phosphoserine phosphatase)